MAPQATRRRNMGSLITSHAMTATLRGFEEGSSFGPSSCSRSPASAADNPDGCVVANSSAAEITWDLSSTVVGNDAPGRSMTDLPIASGLTQPQQSGGFDRIDLYA